MSWVYQPLTNLGGPTVIETDMNSTGAATLSLVSGALAIVILASDGVAAPTFNSGATAQIEIDSDGVGAFSASSATVLPSVLSGDGLTTPSFVGNSFNLTVLNGAGVGAFNAEALSGDFVEADLNSSGVASLSLNGVFLRDGVLSSNGVAALSADSQTIIASLLAVLGVGSLNGISGTVTGSILNSTSVANIVLLAPQQLLPSSFKPIARRDVKLPKLPRGVSPQVWTEIATREFDRFFHDLFHYFSDRTFVGGVHTELLTNGFTITPENSTIFLMANEPVSSSVSTAIKSIGDVPRVLILVNTSLFPITIKDEANTIFGGSDIVLTSGRVALLTHTGQAWVGNAI